MSAHLHEAEQLTMPMPVPAARPTLGQLRAERDALMERLLVLAGHRNQVVSIPRDRLEQIACVAVCVDAVQVDWFIANEPAVQWTRSLPSRRWRGRLHRLRVLGERIVIQEMQSAPNAKRISVSPPPKPPGAKQAELFSETNNQQPTPTNP